MERRLIKLGLYRMNERRSSSLSRVLAGPDWWSLTLYASVGTVVGLETVNTVLGLGTRQDGTRELGKPRIARTSRLVDCREPRVARYNEYL